MKQKTLALISIPLVAGVVLAGCSSSDDTQTQDQAQETVTTTATSPVETTDTTTETSTETSPVDTEPSNDTALAMLGAASTDPTTNWEESNGGAYADLDIKDIRVGSHDGFDRFVLEFAGEGLPSYHAGYVDEPLQQASGMPIDVAGPATLEVMVHGTAAAMMNTDNPLLKSVGPMDKAAGNVQGVTYGGTFEADSQFFIGLDKPRPYSVSVLENPARLVIDIKS